MNFFLQDKLLFLRWWQYWFNKGFVENGQGPGGSWCNVTFVYFCSRTSLSLHWSSMLEVVVRCVTYILEQPISVKMHFCSRRRFTFWVGWQYFLNMQSRQGFWTMGNGRGGSWCTVTLPTLWAVHCHAETHLIMTIMGHSWYLSQPSLSKAI